LTVPAQVHRDEPQIVAECGAELLAPGERALRKAMNEKDGTPVLVASFRDVEVGARPTSDLMTPNCGRVGFAVKFHCFLLLIGHSLQMRLGIWTEENIGTITA
jgi:hypothetical protein